MPEGSFVASDPLGHEPCYIISVAARLVGLHPQTLRYYETAGLLKPGRSPGNRRLYSPADIERLRHIQRLTGEMGVNLAGVETILSLMEEVEQMRAEMEELQARFNHEVAPLKSR
jgi:MerR family transcriptional regulator/heat shock protein HspR